MKQFIYNNRGMFFGMLTGGILAAFGFTILTWTFWLIMIPIGILLSYLFPSYRA